ncbi:MAG: tetratricopeptide repeat protein, partial [Bryobacteraceae bacterium]
MGTKHGPDDKGITTDLRNIFQGLISAALGAGLAPVVVAGWKRFRPDDPPEWLQGTVAPIVGAVVLFASWFVMRLISRAATRRRRATARAKGDRLSVYVARFGEDKESETTRKNVIDSIVRELGKERVEVLPAGIDLRLTEGVSSDVAAHDAAHKARSLLKKKGGDLLIWGQLLSMEGRAVVELRFVSANHDGSEGQRFGFTSKLMLETDFGPEMGAALAAVSSALAAPVFRDAGKYLARTLVPVAERLAPLIRNIPTSMREDDRARLLFSYGLIQTVIGEQSGESARLEEAVAAFREMLREWTRERVPLDWAMTQNNLGNALGRLGERESGTARLGEAVAAYREALREWTRERTPLDWAMTQNNLGNALRSLGERESGTARLEEAVAACREALLERTRPRVPLDWAMTQNNLGNALTRLGERESGTGRLEQAVAAYREALQERTRERVPLDWAMTQNNLGNALWRLGER